MKTETTSPNGKEQATLAPATLLGALVSRWKGDERASRGCASVGGSASLVEQLKASATKLYERAKRERQNLVRLAPQYRKNDKYNAEGEYMQNIKLAIGMRRATLGIAKRLESESSPNDKVLP